MERRKIEQIHPVLCWRIRQEVMYPQEELSFVAIEGDEEAIHHGYFLNNELLGVLSWFIDGEEAQFRKFAVKEKVQGQGIGTEMLQYGLGEMRTLGIRKVWCNARLEKRAFYERFGLSCTDQQFVRHGISYVIMELKT